MICISENKYITSDGHRFVRYKDYLCWQSVLDYIDRFNSDNIGIGQKRYILKSREDAKVLMKYLSTYQMFDFKEVLKLDIYDKFNKIVYVDYTDKKVEVE